MARGSWSWSLTRTALLLPLRSVTEMESVPVSVQYRWEYTQSTASPSAVTTPEDTTTVWLYPESIGALQRTQVKIGGQWIKKFYSFLTCKSSPPWHLTRTPFLSWSHNPRHRRIWCCWLLVSCLVCPGTACGYLSCEQTGGRGGLPWPCTASGLGDPEQCTVYDEQQKMLHFEKKAISSKWLGLRKIFRCLSSGTVLGILKL